MHPAVHEPFERAAHGITNPQTGISKWKHESAQTPGVVEALRLGFVDSP
jgi:hypothetical protein